MKRKNKKSEIGFTLVELLLVVTILGILAALAIPRLFPQTEKGRVAEAIGILSAMRQGEEAYFLEKGTYCDPDTDCTSGWASLGMDDPDGSPDPTAFFNYTVTGADASGFTATATRQNVDDPNGNYSGKTIQLNQAGHYTQINEDSNTHPFVPA